MLFLKNHLLNVVNLCCIFLCCVKLVIFILKLRDDLNVNVEIERFFGFLLRITGADGADFQLKLARFLKTAPEVEAPNASFVDNIKLLSFVTLDNIVLDMLLQNYNCKGYS